MTKRITKIIAMLKKTFKYLMYPTFMVIASASIIILLERGINPYLATVPVIIAFAIAILLIEKKYPYEKDWVKSKGDFNLDSIHYFVNYGIKLIAQFLFVYLVSNFLFLEIFPVHYPFYAQVLLALIIIDFFLFLGHWISHKSKFLWSFHAIHHSSLRLYWLNGEKRHPLHQIFEGSPGIIMCLIIGVPYLVIVGALSILAVNMMLQHCNIDYKVGFLKKVFSVAELHRWHHRTEYKEAQVNYGAFLIVWDILFGTYYDDPEVYHKVGEVGIAEEPNFPTDYLGQLLYPFKNEK